MRFEQSSDSRTIDRPSAAASKYFETQDQIARLLAKDLLFIGGYPKSGTTWLQVMLDAHPEISCRGEGHFLDHFAPLLVTALNTHNTYITAKNESVFAGFDPFPAFRQDHVNHLLLSAMALVLLQLRDSRAARIIGEKTPENVLHFAKLEVLFPDAKFIHVVRDGRDCAVSAWFHNLRTAPGEMSQRYPGFEQFAEWIAGEWKESVELGLRFGAARPRKCMIVHYEDMCLNPHATVQSAFRFLGVSADDDIVQRCVAEGSFEKMSGGRHPGMEDRSSFVRQGRPGNWRDHLTADGLAKFVAVAGDLMGRLGYR